MGTIFLRLHNDILEAGSTSKTGGTLETDTFRETGGFGRSGLPNLTTSSEPLQLISKDLQQFS